MCVRKPDRLKEVDSAISILFAELACCNMARAVEIEEELSNLALEQYSLRAPLHDRLIDVDSAISVLRAELNECPTDCTTEINHKISTLSRELSSLCKALDLLVTV